MTRLIVLTFVPAIAAILFGVRARREMRARTAAEARVAELESAAARPAGARTGAEAPGDDRANGAAAEAAPSARDSLVPGHVLGVVSHELRSPLSAILGYQELLAEGIFGPLDPRAEEALARIRHSAVQLLNLTDGISELAGRNRESDAPDIQDVPLQAILHESVEHLSSEGAGRGVTIELRADEPMPTFRIDRARLRRALDLILAAAVKASPNSVLEVTAHAEAAGRGWRVHVGGVRLDADRDVPRDDGAPVRSGVALRLTMARRAASGIGAAVDIAPAADATFRITLRLPPALD